MKLFHLLASLATAISLVRAADYKTEATVIIFVLKSDRENVIVTAKENSEAPITDLTSTSDHGWCRSTLGLDPVTGECAEPEWAVITSLRFARPTDKPRPVLVKYPDYTIECTFALNQAMDGRVVAWEINNALGLDGKKEDFGMICNDSSAYYSVYGLP